MSTLLCTVRLARRLTLSKLVYFQDSSSTHDHQHDSIIDVEESSSEVQLNQVLMLSMAIDNKLLTTFKCEVLICHMPGMKWSFLYILEPCFTCVPLWLVIITVWLCH